MSGLSERQAAKLRAAQSRGYKWAKPGRLDTLVDGEWVGLLAAGEALGGGDRRLGMLMQAGRLRPALSDAREAGVSKESLDALLRERQGAGYGTRIGYFLRDVCRVVASQV